MAATKTNRAPASGRAQTHRIVRFFLFICAFALAVESHATGLVAAWGSDTYGQQRLPAGVSNIKAIAAGLDHSLALRADGTVFAWGRNIATNIPPGLSNVVAISAGGYHSSVLRTDGTVVTWGNTDIYDYTVFPQANLSNIVALASGWYHALALKSDGRIIGWGINQYNEITAPSTLSNVVAIGAGRYQSLALKANGQLVAWGYYGNNVPAGLSNVVAIACGDRHNLALKSDGTVVAWGDNFFGQTNVPSGLMNVVAITAGTSYSLALRADGSLVPWGANFSGQTNFPAGLGNVRAITAGGAHALALVSEGPVQVFNLTNVAVPYTSNATFSITASGLPPYSYQWVRINSSGQLSTIPDATNSNFTVTNSQFFHMGAYAVIVSNTFGSVISSATLTVISPPFIATPPLSRSIAVGRDTSFSVSAAGTPVLSHQWLFHDNPIPGGTNSTLLLTNVQYTHAGLYSVRVTNIYGSVVSSNVTLTVTDGSPLIRIHPSNQVASVGVPTSLFVFATGSEPMRYQWQFNGVNIPHETNAVLAFDAIRHADVGFYNVVVSNPFGEAFSAKALLSVHQVFAWANGYPFYTPLITNLHLTNIVAIAAGSSHVNFLKADGTLAASAIGFVSPTVTNLPAGLNDVVAISACDVHSLALRGNGTVVGWGTTPPTVPFGLSNVTAVAAGGSHGLALKSDGRVTAWGASPSTAIAGKSNVVAIAADFTYSALLKADGSVSAWRSSSSLEEKLPASWTNIIAISAGGSRIFGLKADGAVVSWGNNPTNIPPDLNNVAALVPTVNYRNWVIRTDGSITNWGNILVPTPGLARVISVAEGYAYYYGFTVALVGSGAPFIKVQPFSQMPTNLGSTTRFHVRAIGVQPMSYQWQLNGYDIPGAVSADLIITNLQTTNLGNYRVVLSNALGTTISTVANLAVPYSGALPAALNTTNIVWTNASPNAPWFGQLAVTHDGAAAAQSGPIGHNQQSILQTTVVGPGTLTFWWRVSSEQNYDFLTFQRIGVQAPPLSISGETSWQKVTVSLFSGTNTLRWIYSKDASVTTGLDAGWVDEVVFTPLAPSITLQPASQTTAWGETVLMSVFANGTPPLSYQWTKGGTNLPGATGSSLLLTEVRRRDCGDYAVQVANSAGSRVSSNATLTVLVPQLLSAPQRLSDNSFSFSFGDVDGGALQLDEIDGFEVQASTNLADWITIAGERTLTNGVVKFRDADAANFPRRFYRVLEH